MPEMPSLPILSSSRPLSGAASAPSSGVTDADLPQGIAGNAGNDASLPGNEGQASFASILKRQLERPASVPTQQGVAAPLLIPETAGGPTTLAADLLARSTLDISALVDPALRQSLNPAGEARLPADASAGGKSEDALSLALDADPAKVGEAALSGKGIADALSLRIDGGLGLASGASTLSGALAEGKLESDRSALPVDDQTQTDAAASNLAALLAFLPAIAPVVTTKADPALKDAGTDSQDASDTQGDSASSLIASMPTLMQTGLGADKEGASANLAEKPLLSAEKTAEFAAPLTASAEGAPLQARSGEAVSAEVSFENMLAAAQVSGQGRMVEAHAGTHAAAPIEVKTPVGTRGWDGDVGDKLVWMVGRQEQRAELVLNPPQLGRVEVSLTMNGDQTNASFVSANPAVRDALEAALPRLREILADAGVSLGQTQVGSESANQTANQSANNRENRDNPSRYSNADDTVSEANILRQSGSSQWLKQGRGLVDTFA